MSDAPRPLIGAGECEHVGRSQKRSGSPVRNFGAGATVGAALEEVVTAGGGSAGVDGDRPGVIAAGDGEQSVEFWAEDLATAVSGRGGLVDEPSARAAVASLPTLAAWKGVCWSP